MSLTTTIALLSATALPAAAGAAPASPRVAAVSVDDDGARATGRAAALHDALFAQPDLVAVDADAFADLVQSAARAGLVCAIAQPDCAARVAAFGGLDFVVLVDEASTGGHTRVRLVDCADGRVVRDADARVTSTEVGGDVRAGLHALVRQALGGPAAQGTVDVTGPAQRAIVVDGRQVAIAPAHVELTAGVHRFGNGDRAIDVDVPAAGSIALRLPAEEPLLSGLAGPSLVGAGTAIAAIGAVGAWLVAPDPASRDQGTAQKYNDAVAAGRGLLVVSGIGAVIALAGTGVWLSFGAGGDA